MAVALLIAGLGTHFTAAEREKADEMQSRYITATYVETKGNKSLRLENTTQHGAKVTAVFSMKTRQKQIFT